MSEYYVGENYGILFLQGFHDYTLTDCLEGDKKAILNHFGIGCVNSKIMYSSDKSVGQVNKSYYKN